MHARSIVLCLIDSPRLDLQFGILFVILALVVTEICVFECVTLIGLVCVFERVFSTKSAPVVYIAANFSSSGVESEVKSS